MASVAREQKGEEEGWRGSGGQNEWLKDLLLGLIRVRLKIGLTGVNLAQIGLELKLTRIRVGLICQYSQAKQLKATLVGLNRVN